MVVSLKGRGYKIGNPKCTKSQITNNIEAPISKFKTGSFLVIDVCDFEFVWSLEFEVCDFSKHVTVGL